MVDDVERSTLRKWVVLLILVGIASGSMAFGKRFGLHSIGTILALLVTGPDRDPGVADREKPADARAGTAERVSVGGYLLWQVVLAVALLREVRE